MNADSMKIYLDKSQIVSVVSAAVRAGLTGKIPKSSLPLKSQVALFKIMQTANNALKWVDVLSEKLASNGIREVKIGKFNFDAAATFDREQKVITVDPDFDRVQFARQIKRNYGVTIDQSEIGALLILHEGEGHCKGQKNSQVLKWIYPSVYEERENKADRQAIQEFLRLRKEIEGGG